MTNQNDTTVAPNPPILSYVKDLPNVCSLAGLACTVLSIYFSITGVFYAALIGMIWAVAFDWADGLIARRMKGRTGDDSVFGGQLDLIIDIVSYGVAPAILLLSYGGFNFLLLPIAFTMIAAGAIRLSYFSTYGLTDDSQYTGLAIDNNNIALVGLFLIESLLAQGLFLVILCISCLGLAALNVSQIKTPKLSGNPRNVYLLAIYTIGITGVYIWQYL